MIQDVYLLQQAIDKWGEDAQMKMVLEEMSELQKEICKLWRGKDNRDAIAEEVADVEIMLDQLKLMLRINEEVQTQRRKKISRLADRLGFLRPGISIELGSKEAGGGTSWWLRKPTADEPACKTCLNCGRSCKREEPSGMYCPHWASPEELMIQTDMERSGQNERG